MGPSGARESHGTEEFEREAIGEIFVRQIQEVAAFGRARIVHHDVDAPKTLNGELHDALAGVGRAQVKSNRFRGSAGAADLGRGGIEQRLIARA
ncbi:MAG: hypothetical protein JWO19_3215 [Bryobacterales bacterium]|nr:hypothetical protein [Bryobacterales bacterium]